MENSNISVSKAIIIGAAIIAVVIGGSFVYQQRYISKNMPVLVQKAIKDLTPSPENVPAITKADHILGEANAPVQLVVYTDLECPFCKTFHNSIIGLKDNYIKDGKIAVIYRNLPLLQLHKKAETEAIATECAAKLGGNEKYWSYVDKIFAATPSNDQLDLNLLTTFAKDIGLNEADFAKCQKDSAIKTLVAQQLADGEKAGAQGTPYPIVIYKGQVKGALPGALPTDQLKKMVDTLLEEKAV